MYGNRLEFVFASKQGVFRRNFEKAVFEDFYHRNIHTKADENRERHKRLSTYSILVVCSFLLQVFQTFGFNEISLRISKQLHKSLFISVMRAYMIFFKSNSTGSILKRVSSDLWRIDIKLPQAMLDSFSFLAEIITVICIVGMINYWLLLPAVVFLTFLYITRALYSRLSRNLQKVESITFSRVYSHVNKTFQGLTTIRAFKAAKKLELDFHEHQDLNTSAVYLSMATNRAFTLCLDVLCGIYVALVCFSFLITERNFNSGEVGLAITQSLMLLFVCQCGMRRTIEMENLMASVERVMEYIKLPKEPVAETSETMGLTPEWPNRGFICFKNVRLRYGDTTLYALKGVNISIRTAEKIGIVGRRDAGKSSIIESLFRLAIIEGRIEIDGFDTALLGLYDLRSRLSIVTQDPCLFSGTLRLNLDPFGDFKDVDLWHALDDVQLKSFVSSLEGGLDCNVLDLGVNFSTGQRQLFCLARAILRRNKILIVVEAAANDDFLTDKLVQETIRTKFRQCTVLTIAHRLRTVMDSDRVLVMESGHVTAMDHPHVLLQKKKGYFYKLVEKSGIETAEQLRHLAEESFKLRSKRI